MIPTEEWRRKLYSGYRANLVSGNQGFILKIVQGGRGMVVKDVTKFHKHHLGGHKHHLGGQGMLECVQGFI